MNKFAQLGLIFFTGLSSILSAQYNQEDYLKFAANEFIEGAKSQAIKTKKPISELGIADDFTNVYSYTYERKGIFFEFQLDEIHKSYDQIKYSLSLNGNTDSLNISYFDVDPLKGFEKKEYSGIAEVVDIKNDAVLFDTGNFSFASYDRKQPSLKSNKEVDLANENLISTLKKLTLILYRTTVVESESVYKLNFFHVWDHISISVEKNDLFFF